jgi:uncharacterized membrane protein YoaK (UPF0700 family)
LSSERRCFFKQPAILGGVGKVSGHSEGLSCAGYPTEISTTSQSVETVSSHHQRLQKRFLGLLLVIFSGFILGVILLLSLLGLFALVQLWFIWVPIALCYVIYRVVEESSDAPENAGPAYHNYN